jgi:5-methylthioribose kinase
VDTFVNASEAFVTTPLMNQSGDQITFTVSNLTDTDMEFIFEVTDQTDGQPVGINEYTLAPKRHQSL